MFDVVHGGSDVGEEESENSKYNSLIYIDEVYGGSDVGEEESERIIFMMWYMEDRM